MANAGPALPARAAGIPVHMGTIASATGDEPDFDGCIQTSPQNIPFIS
jgi:hypothetical protein